MIDLHTHTTISDGTVSPKGIIREAKSIGLSAVAITDHDCIEGLDEARIEADRLGITYIKGIEFSVAYGENRLIHVLGLGIEPQCAEFLSIYTRFRQEKASRLPHVLRRLHSMGVQIELEDIEAYTTGAYPDRQAIAKCLVAKGVAPSIKYAWIDFLDHIDYFEGELISPEDAFSAIHAAGGKAFMAHFHLPIGLKGYSEEEAYSCLSELKSKGLDGIEYYYPSFTEEDKLRCGQYIKDFDFLMSGGTDFHGGNRPQIKLGTGEGDFKVPDKLLEQLYTQVLAS